MCDDIGEAAYTTSLVAAALVARLRALPQASLLEARLEARYRFDPGGLAALSPEDVVAAVARAHGRDEVERAGTMMLHDFRTGALGKIALELPPN